MNKARVKNINVTVRTSIVRLLSSAQKSYESKSESKSRRYVQMAFDLVRKNKVRLTGDLKNTFCKKCLLIWIPNETVRLNFDTKNDLLRVVCNCGFSKSL